MRFQHKLGVERMEEEKLWDPFGIGHRNETGKQLIKFYLESNLSKGNWPYQIRGYNSIIVIKIISFTYFWT